MSEQHQYPATPSSIAPPDSAYSRKSTAMEGAKLEGDGDSIRVVVRVRPLNTLEKQRNDNKVVTCADDFQTLKLDGVINGKPIPSMTFHRVFDESTNQDIMFNTCGVINLLDRAVEGYNCTLFAYGQTGSGKTHTVTGGEDIPFNTNTDRWGIVPRSLRYLFDLINKKQAIEETRFTVHACYLEIYNEQVQDLLNPSSTSLPVRFGTEKGFYVENLFVVECEVLDDCLAVLEEGLRNRRTGSHRLNEHSSRSHGMMTIHVESETVDPDDQRVIRRKGKICFVDLAGSERVKESRATGDTLTETLNINKSLLTLGNCISALSEMKKKNSNVHVPYRDSKLTKLLSDTLGGTGMTLMIACVSPSGFNMNETVNTLRYASRAKRIQNRPVIQMDPREELIMNLKKELKLTKSENDSLRQMVMELSNGDPGRISEKFFGTVVRTSSSSAYTSRSTPSSSRIPSIPPIASSIPNQITAPQENIVAKETPELIHTKKMLTQFMEENNTLKTANAEMTTASHKLSRENRELMEENDRLIGKIEKLVEIFGNNLEQESSTGVQSNTTTTVSALNTGAGNARLYLLSRRALRKKDETEQEGEKGQLKGRMIHIGVDFTKNHTIDRSLSDIRYTPSKEEAPADTPESTSQPAQPTKTAAAGSKKNSLRGGESLPAKDKEAKEPSRISSRRNSETKDNSSLNQIQKNKDQLKKELRDLDAEIKSLQK